MKKFALHRYVEIIIIFGKMKKTIMWENNNEIWKSQIWVCEYSGTLTMIPLEGCSRFHKVENSDA